MKRPSLPRRLFPALLAGLPVGFVAAVDLARAIGPALLFDRDPSWAPFRLLLGLAVIAAGAAAAGLAAAILLLASGSRLLAGPLGPLPFRRASLAALALLALAAGIAARSAPIGDLPFSFLEDDVNLITPALELSGTAHDFADAIRPIPYGRPDPHEMIGVAYLRLLRESLRVFGTTITASRFPSLLGGVLSLVTAGLLARALLPRGGAALAVLALAGLRWHAILSVSGWHSILLVPLVDAATIGVLASRRGRPAVAASLGGAILGIGAHLYLASWVAASALGVFAAWPDAASPGLRPDRRRLLRVLAFGTGFLIVAAPVFLLHEGRRISYFGRSGHHNVLKEVGYQKSWLPVWTAAADAIPAPWFVPEPEGRHDLPGKSRLGLVVGVFFAIVLARAIRSPREELSGLILLHAGFAAAAAVASGSAGHPNGFRFGYLTSLTAVAASAGALAFVAALPENRRRAGAIAAVGALAIAGLVGLRQAFVEWPSAQTTFDSFHGEDTLVGRAAARWGAFGTVAVASRIGRSDLTIETVRRYRLDPDPAPSPSALPAGVPPRGFRLVKAGDEPLPGERTVERVRDPWGRDWASVYARRDR